MIGVTYFVCAKGEIVVAWCGAFIRGCDNIVAMDGDPCLEGTVGDWYLTNDVEDVEDAGWKAEG